MKKYLLLGCLLLSLDSFSQSSLDGLLEFHKDPTLVFWLPITNNTHQTESSIYKHSIDTISKKAIFGFDRFNKLGAYTFTSTNATYIQTKKSQVFAYSTISICTWVKTNTSKIGRLVVLPTVRGGQLYSLNLNLSASKTEDSKGKASIYFDPEDDKGAVSLLSKTNVVDDKWHFIVGIINSETMRMKIYVDGVLEAVKEFSSKPKPDVLAKLQIGRHSEKYQEYFDGSLDDIGIFKRELTKDEITSLFHERN